MASGFIPIYVPPSWDDPLLAKAAVMRSPSTHIKWIIDIAKTLNYLEHFPDVTNNEYKLLTTDGIDILWNSIKDFPIADPIIGIENVLIDQSGDKQVTLNDVKAFISNSFSTNNFISKETPLGTHDGINKIFNLSFLPILKTEHVYLNGQLQDVNDDYIILNKKITFTIAPEIISKIRISYFK